MIAKSYAPELDLAGVAAAAPATELATLLADDINTDGGRNLTAITLWSWARVQRAERQCPRSRGAADGRPPCRRVHRNQSTT